MQMSWGGMSLRRKSEGASMVGAEQEGRPVGDGTDPIGPRRAQESLCFALSEKGALGGFWAEEGHRITLTGTRVRQGRHSGGKA